MRHDGPTFSLVTVGGNLAEVGGLYLDYVQWLLTVNGKVARRLQTKPGQFLGIIYQIIDAVKAAQGIVRPGSFGGKAVKFMHGQIGRDTVDACRRHQEKDIVEAGVGFFAGVHQRIRFFQLGKKFKKKLKCWLVYIYIY